MPFVANTPESLLGRSDSKNPNSTCRGITSSGRPCRRPVAAAAAAQTLLPQSRKSKISDYDPRDESLYCWQHKEQASLSARSSPGPRATATPILEERTSLDTLADRLGLVELEQKKEKKQRRRQNGYSMQAKPTSGHSKPPLMTRPKPNKELHFCCFTIPLDEVEDSPAPRPQPRPLQMSQPGRVSRPPNGNLAVSNSRPRPSLSTSSPGRSSQKSSKQLSGSQTSRLLSLIPAHTEPTIASALMAELARPYVDSEEAGYIYMFWMTPSSEKTTPPVEAARSLLAPPSGGAAGQRRPSDVVSSYAKSKGGTKDKTMLLKIGRAQNVQRRMQQWSKQCGYEVEVIRYYPYLPGASEASGAIPRMTPHCHRVERLVHIELTGLGLHATRETCDACGREHREWFEVPATREGIGSVDEVIRRWVEWDESEG